MPEDPQHDRVAHDPPQALVAHIIGAQQVAVHQQHLLAVEVDDGPVFDQPAAGVAAETVSKHEVAIAVHRETRHSGSGELPQCGHDDALGRVRVVIADPGFEEVAEDVERAGAARLVPEKREELRGDVGPGRVQVQIRNEERAQWRRRVPAVALLRA